MTAPFPPPTPVVTDADVAQAVVRMIHACGMTDLPADIDLSPDFAEVAESALRRGAPILCDARMVASGVTRARLPADNDVLCLLRDPRVPALAAEIGNTRSAAALELWGERLAGAVVAIGNAPTGAAWTAEGIRQRQDEVRAGGLEWEVVESIPVSEEIKTQTGDWRAHVANWAETLRRLADSGIRTVCYNFMPVLDWTRTDLAWRRPNGARCMRFDLVDFAAFDIHILARPGAAQDFPPEVAEAAARLRASPPTAALICGRGSSDNAVAVTTDMFAALPVDYS